MTSATSWPAAASAASARSANGGVPAKARRRKKASGRLAQLLGEASADALLLELRQMLDEDLALQVIHLVLDAHREQPLRLEGEGIAVLVVGANLCALGSFHQLVDPRDRKATFLDVRNPGRFHDFGIDQHDK